MKIRIKLELSNYENDKEGSVTNSFIFEINPNEEISLIEANSLLLRKFKEALEIYDYELFGNKNTAEYKAIQRIKNLDESEWETVSQPGDPIDLDEINKRLKERGYIN